MRVHGDRPDLDTSRLRHGLVQRCPAGHHNAVIVARRVPFAGDEKSSLRVSLDRHRDAVVWKVEGLRDADLRREMTPSGTNLLGLIKHLAAVEYGWFCQTFGRATEPLPFDDRAVNADLRATPDETPDGILAFY